MSPLDLGGLYCGSTSTREREVMVAICAAGARILHLLSIFCAVVMGLSTLFIRALMPQRVWVCRLEKVSFCLNWLGWHFRMRNHVAWGYNAQPI